MVMLYWEIGRIILQRQAAEGWGSKVIDRLSADLRDAFPDMKGLSPRNLKYMRAFAEAWPDRAIVQQLAAQIPWFHNCLLLDRVEDSTTRRWYIQAAIENGWSRHVLSMQIDRQAHKRQGKAVNNFALTLPPADSDMARRKSEVAARLRLWHSSPMCSACAISALISTPSGRVARARCRVG